MKRLISAVLALTLLGGTAAAASPYNHGDVGVGSNGYNGQAYDSGYRNRDGDDRYRDRVDNGGAVVAGIGLLTLAAILAAQNQRHYRNNWYGRGRGYGYSNRYNDSGYNYDRRDAYRHR